LGYAEAGYSPEEKPYTNSSLTIITPKSQRANEMNREGTAPSTSVPPTLRRNFSRREFLKLAIRTTAGATIAGVSSFGYATNIEPYWIDIQHVRLTLPYLAAAFHSYKVAQLSDLHMGDWLTRSRLEEAVALTNEQKPDLVVITGDFVSSISPTVTSDLVEVLGTLRAADRVVAVLGNHDYWTDVTVIRQVLRDSNIADVSNDVHTLRRNGAMFHIAGVDDIWEGKDKLDVVLGKLPAQGAALLLAHEPDFADTSAATGRFDLQLSGHSHGGQVVVPFLGPLRLPPYGKKYPAGLYQVGGMLQYTNRGVGMISPHVRFNCRPEITLFTLESPGLAK
jgi:predicted MPP superfamily phosphohydrolase